jgi:hypothetical protein
MLLALAMHQKLLANHLFHLGSNASSAGVAALQWAEFCTATSAENALAIGSGSYAGGVEGIAIGNGSSALGRKQYCDWL